MTQVRESQPFEKGGFQGGFSLTPEVSTKCVSVPLYFLPQLAYCLAVGLP